MSSSTTTATSTTITTTSLESRLSAFHADYPTTPQLLDAFQRGTWKDLQLLLEKYGISAQQSNANQSFIVERIDAMTRSEERGDGGRGGLENYSITPQHPHHQPGDDDANSDARSTIAPSSLAPSTLRQDHDHETDAASMSHADDASLHSRHRLLPSSFRRPSTARNSISTYIPRAASLSFPASSSYAQAQAQGLLTNTSSSQKQQQQQQRRATTGDYLTTLHSSRTPFLPPLPVKQKKTAGRKAFLGVCGVVNLVMPLDVHDEKTSMGESSLVKVGVLFKGKGGGGNIGSVEVQ